MARPCSAWCATTRSIPTHFLRETHDFDVAALVRAERGLTRLFARLPGRKVLLTNAPMAYASDRPARARGAPALPCRVTRSKACGCTARFGPKPSRMMLRAMLARERVPAADAVLVEDSTVNLKAARALGFRTVLMTGHGTRSAGVMRLRAAPRARREPVS